MYLYWTTIVSLKEWNTCLCCLEILTHTNPCINYSPLGNYSKGDDAFAIFHHIVHICGAPPTWAGPLHCVQSCFQLTTMSAANMYGFFSNCFQSVPMNSKKYMECLSILLFLWDTHPWMIPWHLMSVYVAARHRILCGAGNVFCLPATSIMIVQAMQTCTVVDVAFFFPRHPSA